MHNNKNDININKLNNDNDSIVASNISLNDENLKANEKNFPEMDAVNESKLNLNKSSEIITQRSSEFKNNYGTTSASTPQTPPTIYCLHGQQQVELRGHCHRQRTEGVDLKARKKLIIASILCVFFMIAEIIGGVLSNSLAIATDAAHLLTDFASFMISLFALWIAGRPSTQKMSFGWYRAEVIGALASVAMIWVITAILVWLAIERIINKTYEVDANIMLITSGLAILVNVLMGCQLHTHSHGGGGGHSHGGSSSVKMQSPKSTDPSSDHEHDGVKCIEKNPQVSYRQLNTGSASGAGVMSPNNLLNNNDKNNVVLPLSNTIEDEHNHAEIENMNVRAAFIHVLGDVLQSIGVFLAALTIYFKPEWAIADPICTFIFSIIVLCTTFAIMKDALLVLMEGTPSYLDYAEVMGILIQIDGVERVHNLRIWALSVSKVAISVHLAIRPGANPKKILEEANTAVHLRYNFFETTFQIEDLTPDMDNCQQCSIPNS